ncbi:hypothetical protein CCYS_00515 [Corynebacterium cystitidis DSM 20524]|uniref:Uncharacterized protein n=1 Tax=Corynebacterium cystitidis DSM 20524 TaxID=1121357 RepID=A0A1H9VU73_9CORY|nr:hypothetical protein CCYS_00515 [Corynebacterium cystitidis DSM 20524]SES24833.1 hypothetical protein SAMN05661109_02374 [Corynebacterium cystitidis DSM 20524]SNV90076.1 Uncharacterised protein [Corynebacterium cystitidis]
MAPRIDDSTGLDAVSPKTHKAQDATHFRPIIAVNEQLAECKPTQERVLP